MQRDSTDYYLCNRLFIIRNFLSLFCIFFLLQKHKEYRVSRIRKKKQSRKDDQYVFFFSIGLRWSASQRVQFLRSNYSQVPRQIGLHRCVKAVTRKIVFNALLFIQFVEKNKNSAVERVRYLLTWLDWRVCHQFRVFLRKTRVNN